MRKNKLILSFFILTAFFTLYGKCGNNNGGGGGGNAGPAPTGSQQRTITIPPEINNILALNTSAGVPCVYDNNVTQTILISVFYLDANGVKKPYGTLQTFTSVTVTAAGIHLSNVNVPTDGDFWVEAEVIIDCSRCCGHSAILQAYGLIDGCNAVGMPPVELGRPKFYLETTVYKAVQGAITDGQGASIADLAFRVKGWECKCNC